MFGNRSAQKSNFLIKRVDTHERESQLSMPRSWRGQGQDNNDKLNWIYNLINLCLSFLRSDRHKCEPLVSMAGPWPFLMGPWRMIRQGDVASCTISERFQNFDVFHSKCIPNACTRRSETATLRPTSGKQTTPHGVSGPQVHEANVLRGYTLATMNQLLLDLHL